MPTIQNRRQTRYCCEGSANVRVLRVESKFQGRVLDLSASGAFIGFDQPFRIEFGHRVELELVVVGIPFRAMGCVRVTEPARGVGVEFTDLSARGQRQLQQILAELQGPASPAGSPQPFGTIKSSARIR